MKELLGKFLIFLGCKDLSLMLYGLEHFKPFLLLDGMFFGKYKYIGDNATKEFALKYKEYLDVDDYKKNLLKGLNDESIKTVNQIERNIKFILKGEKPYIRLSDFGIKENETEIKKYINKYTKNIYLPIDNKEETCFYYKHGINFVKNLKQLLKGKDIMDCGAYVGDSAIMFSKEIGVPNEGGVNRIYCLEPDPSNKKLLQDTISNNNLKNKIVPISLGVGYKKEILYINGNGSASTIGSKSKDSHAIQIDTIDNIVQDYGINPGLIKRDIEGMEYESLLGCKETIKQYRPILLISIYHNGRDFYEIKPLIESRNLGYKFKIRHLSTHPFFETMLICYL